MSFPFQYEVDQCLQVLTAGGIILYPTDTVWGIGCDATCEEAVDRIYQLKHRADHNAMIVLVADE
jgi:L-threonylcarbamoyladenylate synthase